MELRNKKKLIKGIMMLMSSRFPLQILYLYHTCSLTNSSIVLEYVIVE